MNPFRRRPAPAEAPDRAAAPPTPASPGAATTLAPEAFDVAARSVAGPRSENQDRAALGRGWAVVSDGMGGYAGGARAAELTVGAAAPALAAATAAELPPPRRAEAVAVGVAEAANQAVRAGRDADPAVGSMGATLALALLCDASVGASRWLVATVGDSPVWVVGATGTRQASRDHTLATALAATGAISAEEAAVHRGRHLLTRAIGIEDDVDPDTLLATLAPGEALLLASDGVSDVLGPAELHHLVAGRPAAAAADALVDAALAAGTRDNVTVVVVRHPEVPPPGRTGR